MDSRPSKRPTLSSSLYAGAAQRRAFEARGYAVSLGPPCSITLAITIRIKNLWLVSKQTLGSFRSFYALSSLFLRQPRSAKGLDMHSTCSAEAQRYPVLCDEFQARVDASHGRRQANSRSKSGMCCGIVYPVATERMEHNITNIKKPKTVKRNGPSGRG